MPMQQILLGAAGSAPYSGNVVIAHEDSPYISTFPFTSDGGFGTRYTNPSTLPSSHRFAAEFSAAGDYVAVGGQTAGRLDVYEWSSSGYGTRYGGNPTDTVRDISWHPDGNAIAIAQESTSPYIMVWAFSNSGFGTQFSNPSSGPSSSARGIAFNPATGNSIISSGYGTTNIHAWAWSSSGFGTKYSGPTTPSGVLWDVAFSSDGNYVLAGSDASPRINVWPWDDSSGFGSKYSDPSTLPGDASWGVAMSPDNTAVASAGQNSPYLDVWAFDGSSGFGSKYSNPSSGLPTQAARDVAWTPDGAAIILVYGGGTKVSAWAWDDSSGFGTKFSDPSQSVYDAWGVHFQPV